MVFGDSNTYRPDGSDTRWTMLLKGKNPVDLNIFTEGCDGRTTIFDYGECNGIEAIKKKLSLYLPLDYVFVMLGTNDVKNKYGPPNVADIASGMSQIFDYIDKNSYGVKSILLTPPPLGEVTDGELAGAQSRIPPLVEEYRLLAMNREIYIIDVFPIININTDLESDRIHLNALGREKIADAVWSELKVIIGL